MSFSYLFLVGTLIGTAMIIPGVSGGVLAVIFGVYNKMIESLSNLFKDFKRNFIFLFVLGLGILIGAVWFSNVLMFLYNRHEALTKFCFIGLILGGVPFLFSEIKQKKEKVNYLALILTTFFSVMLVIISKDSFTLNINHGNSLLNLFNLFLAGIIYSIGKVVPGISGSFLLIIIGMYEFVLSLFASPIRFGIENIDKVIPFGIGLITGVFTLLKIVKYLLDKKFSSIYSIIIGFVIGSIFMLIPVGASISNYVTGVVMMLFCFILSLKLTK